MDERLEAGRHHLANGERALQQGYLDDSRSHFEAALLQFRGPDLRLGEAHALRGLAQIALGSGQSALAEETIRASIRSYQDVRDLLGRIDREGLSHELRRDAEEGEGAALVLLGDLLLRSGRGVEARQTLSYAREIFGSLGDVPSAAGVWIALGRLAIRAGRLDDARDGFERAVQIHERSGDIVGQCGVWLAMSDLERVDENFDEAEQHIDRAVSLARESKRRVMEGRALSHLGSLMLQRSRLDDAEKHYEAALPLLREAGDNEMEGYAQIGRGDACSRKASPGAVHYVADGARILGAVDHKQGLGAAMLVLSQHALRFGQPRLALATAESARQLWYQLDPVRGAGQAVRMIVKSLAAQKQWQAVVLAAHYRTEVVQGTQPNAADVRAFYRQRAPAEWLVDIDALSADQLEGRTEAAIHEILESQLEGIDLIPQSLGTVGAALALVEEMLKVPLAAQTAADPEPRALPEAAIEALPPEPAEADFVPAAGPSEDRAEAGAPAEAPTGYDYDAPGLDDTTDDVPFEEQNTEDLFEEDPFFDRLAAEPVPDEYANLYELPADDEEE